MHPLTPQTSFDNVVLIQLLGSGPLGELWLAENPGNNRRHMLCIATSEVAAELLHKPDSPLRTIVSLPPHDNVVHVHDMLPNHEPPYIVYEDVGGTDLIQYLDYTGPLPVEQTFTLLDHLLAGLVHVHDQGICHGDMRPANIWIDDSGRPRLIHIGVGYGRRLRFANPGAAASVVPWLPPEVRAGQVPGVAADLYGIALIGLRAFTSSSPNSKKFWRDLHMGAFKPEVALWFERMTEEDPDSRFATALAAREAFSAARQGKRPDMGPGSVHPRAAEQTAIGPVSTAGRGSHLVDSRNGDVLKLQSGTTAIGRIPGNDVIIPLPLVSKRHARIVRVGDDLYLEDLNSANGTLVNERRVAERALLKDGDTIRVAPTTQNPAGVREYTFRKGATEL